MPEPRKSPVSSSPLRPAAAVTFGSGLIHCEHTGIRMWRFIVALTRRVELLFDP